MRISTIAFAGASALLCANAASAAHISTFTADLQPLSGSGVSGSADLTLDRLANTLRVRIGATGLAPNQLHVQHIHGLVGPDGSAGDSTTPTLADDSDGDGIIELVEGAPVYGPIILGLSDADGAFPTAPGGTIDYDFTFDLASTQAFGDGFGPENLFPLDFREIVIHGGFLGAVGVDSGRAVEEANGVAGYKAFLPVAAGEITPAPIPLPAAGWLLIAGTAGLAALGRRRRS